MMNREKKETISMTMRGICYTLASAGFLAVCPLTVHADTIHMKNGIEIEGIVQSQDDVKTLVKVDTRDIVLRTDEIESIEKNEKTGAIDRAKLQEDAAKRDAELTQLTGLDAAQRIRVKNAMQLLAAPDPNTQSKGVRDLVALSKEMSVYRYLEYCLPSLLPRFTPGVLEAMLIMDPVKTVPHLRDETGNIDGPSRGKAIELIGRAKDADGVGLVVRGLVDHVPEIRVLAAQSLAMMQTKAATPALIGNLKAVDKRVQAAALDALKVIWSVDGQPAPQTSIDDWNALWQSQSASVGAAFRPEDLQPLVAPGAQFVDE